MSAGGTAKRGQCRIIAGSWRGRMIRFEDAAGLRPTTDRIRETVFNWLQSYIVNSSCLDCFAGSGVLGFEALSRGAQQVVALELNRKTVDNLKLNADRLAASEMHIYHVETLHWLRTVKQGRQIKPFDLVFLDPPFDSGLLAETAEALNNSGCLAEDAIIYVEHAADAAVSLPANWHCLRDKKTGQVVYRLFQYRPGRA